MAQQDDAPKKEETSELDDFTVLLDVEKSDLSAKEQDKIEAVETVSHDDGARLAGAIHSQHDPKAEVDNARVTTQEAGDSSPTFADNLPSPLKSGDFQESQEQTDTTVASDQIS
jgi:hypothetical protein